MLAPIASLVAWALLDDLADEIVACVFLVDDEASDEIGACVVLVDDEAAALQIPDCMRICVVVFVCVFAIAELL